MIGVDWRGEARSKHNCHLTLDGDSYNDQHIVSKLLEVSDADVPELNHSTPRESKPMRWYLNERPFYYLGS